MRGRYNPQCRDPPQANAPSKEQSCALTLYNLVDARTRLGHTVTLRKGQFAFFLHR
jgi:hypothetical protein